MMVQQTTPDWIVIDYPTNGTVQAQIYQVPPNMRCQFFIVNSLEGSGYNASFTVA